MKKYIDFFEVVSVSEAFDEEECPIAENKAVKSALDDFIQQALMKKAVEETAHAILAEKMRAQNRLEKEEAKRQMLAEQEAARRAILEEVEFKKKQKEEREAQRAEDPRYGSWG